VPQNSASCPAQFFLRQEDIGKSRAEATLPRLAELNAYVPVRLLPGQPGQGISVDLVKGFQVRKPNAVINPYMIHYYQVVVLCGVPYSKQLEINNWTHANDVPFIAADTHGLFGYA
jgi:ubiquitin-activating enzyme E1